MLKNVGKIKLDAANRCILPIGGDSRGRIRNRQGNLISPKIYARGSFEKLFRKFWERCDQVVREM